MLEDIKKELMKNTDNLIQVLEHYDYCNIVNHGKYISFGRDESSSKKSIVIRTEDNPFVFVNDYARNVNKDIFSYIMSQRHVEFTDVLGVVKATLGINDYYDFFNKKSVFGGFYERIKKKSGGRKIRIHSESELDCFESCGNMRFLKDNISLKTQKKFNIKYDVESQSIVIPIYDQLGQLMGAKCRKNYEDDDMKYFYAIPCQASQTLYGYCQNYSSLVENTIFVFEAEKAVQQCDTYGINNAVALGSGSISTKQVQMLLECHPAQIIFMHDNKYEKEAIMKNINKVKRYSRFSEVEIGYWNWRYSKFSEYGKVSPSDLGKNNLMHIIQNEIIILGKDDEVGEEEI